MNWNQRQRLAAEVRWENEWEEYADLMERMAKLPAALLSGFQSTLSEIRALPEA